MWRFDPEHGVHSTLCAMITRHKPDNGATKRRSRPESAEHGGPYRIKSQRCGRHTNYKAPTVKQHLAAMRMLYDWLIVGQVVGQNPAAAVRGPRHVVKKGKTPVLDGD